MTPPGVGAATRLRDIATLSRGLDASPASIYHANGRKAVTMGVSFIPGVNVIDVGHALEAKLEERMERWMELSELAEEIERNKA